MQNVVDLAEKLLARPSLTPNDAGCQKLLSERLTSLGFVCEAINFEDVENLWATFGSSGPLIVFAGHTDVVPTGPLTDWSNPPFQPTIKEGLLYGRGASDMKAAIAAMVIACEKFIEDDAHFRARIGFLITSDEEGPALHGTKRVIETLTERGTAIDYCIIGEPSSIHQVGDQVRTGRRGSFHGKLIIHGKQGHVAHSHLAENPIHQSLLALDELVKTTWDEGNADFPPTSFQITNIHGGTGAANVIPGHLEVAFNFRFGTANTPESLQVKTESILTRHKLKFNIEWKIGALPFLTKRGKLIEATQKAIREITQLETKLSTGGGTSDGRFIAPTGAEVVELGTSHATAHQVDECISIEDLEALAKIYYSLLKNLIRAHD